MDLGLRVMLPAQEKKLSTGTVNKVKTLLVFWKTHKLRSDYANTMLSF